MAGLRFKALRPSYCRAGFALSATMWLVVDLVAIDPERIAKLLEDPVVTAQADDGSGDWKTVPMETRIAGASFYRLLPRRLDLSGDQVKAPLNIPAQGGGAEGGPHAGDPPPIDGKAPQAGAPPAQPEPRVPLAGKAGPGKAKTAKPKAP